MLLDSQEEIFTDLALVFNWTAEIESNYKFFKYVFFYPP